MSIKKKFTMKINVEIEKKFESIGLRYLSRFETSEKQFLNFLRKKFSKIDSALKPIEKETIINDILIKMKKMNYIDDTRYSNLKSEKMFNNGTSKRMIKVKLKEKGIPDDIINNSLDTLLENNKNDFSSALIYIKKRKIGIFYQKEFNKKDNDLLKHKWYGTLARKGFSYDIVKKVLELDDLTEAENIINRIKF